MVMDDICLESKGEEKPEEIGIIESLENSRLRAEELLKENKSLTEEIESLKREIESLKSDLQRSEERSTSIKTENKMFREQIDTLTAAKRELEEEKEKLEKEIGRQKDVVKQEKGARWRVIQSIRNAIGELGEFDSGQIQGDLRDEEKKEKKLKALICFKDVDRSAPLVRERLERDFPDIKFDEYEVKMGHSTVPDADVYLRLRSLGHREIYFIENRIPKDIIIAIIGPEQASTALANWLKSQ